MIYRMMDKVFPKINQIKQMTFEKTRSLFPERVDLVLFDVTTLYFESIEVDELRNFGYSKDHRFNTTQVVLALATNQDGLPISYELFEGNKAEVGTLAKAIESWKTLFKIDSVCFVGDRAMFSKDNIKLSALFSRNTSRDLFDAHYLLTKCDTEVQKLRLAFVTYLAMTEIKLSNLNPKYIE